MTDKYILNADGEPEPCEDIIRWSQWFENAPARIVKHTVIRDAPKLWVSTVFLGLDHSFGEGRRPILWETMIFDGPEEDGQWRYYTRAEAVAHHDQIVTRLYAGLPAPDDETSFAPPPALWAMRTRPSRRINLE